MTVGNATARWRNVVTLVSAGVAVGLGVPALAAPPTYHLTDLGTLGGNSSFGNGINASGKISGTDTNQGLAFHSSGKTPPITLTNLGFLYTGGQMYKLNDLVNNLGGLTIQTANGINDNGDIVASGGDGINYEHAFLLTRNVAATPEPGTVAMLSASGLGGLVMLRRRRRK